MNSAPPPADATTVTEAASEAGDDAGLDAPVGPSGDGTVDAPSEAGVDATAADAADGKTGTTDATVD